MKKSRSVLKNIRKTARRRAANLLKKKKLKAALKKIKKMTPKEALKNYPEVQSIIDKSVQDRIITKNTGSRYKARLLRFLKAKK